jgi:hypothetical protein
MAPQSGTITREEKCEKHFSSSPPKKKGRNGDLR